MSGYCDEAEIIKKCSEQCSDSALAEALARRNFCRTYDKFREIRNIYTQTCTCGDDLSLSGKSCDHERETFPKNEQLQTHGSRTRVSKMKRNYNHSGRYDSDDDKPMSSKMYKRKLNGNNNSCDSLRSPEKCKPSHKKKKKENYNQESDWDARKATCQKKKSSHCHGDDDDDDVDDEFNEDGSCRCAADKMKKLCTCDDCGKRKKPCFCAAKMKEIQKNQLSNCASKRVKAWKTCDCHSNSYSFSQTQNHLSSRNQNKSRYNNGSPGQCTHYDEEQAVAYEKHVENPKRNGRSARRKQTEKSFWSFLNCCGGKPRSQSEDSVISDEYEIHPKPDKRSCSCHLKNPEICPYCHGQVGCSRKTCLDFTNEEGCTCSKQTKRKKSKKGGRKNRRDWESPKIKNVYGGGCDNYCKPGYYD